MHQQKVERQRLKPLQGLGAILTILLALAADWGCTRLLALVTDEGAALIAFWLIGLCIALWALRRYILVYDYLLSPQLLRVCFAYGRYERLMTDIYLNNVLFVGEESDARQRYPRARVTRAALAGCPLEALAVVCRDGGKPAIYVLQPDATIRAALTEAAQKKRK